MLGFCLGDVVWSMVALLRFSLLVIRLGLFLSSPCWPKECFWIALDFSGDPSDAVT